MAWALCTWSDEYNTGGSCAGEWALKEIKGKPRCHLLKAAAPLAGMLKCSPLRPSSACSPYCCKMMPFADARELRIPMAPPGQAVMAMPTGPGIAPAWPPGQVAMFAPGQVAMFAGPGLFAQTGMEQLNNMTAVDVQERANMLQEVTAILGMEVQMANRYRVLDRAGNQVYYAVERTDCCRRQLQMGCCHDCAPWEVDVLYTPPIGPGYFPQQFMALRRPCQCTCLCCNRPVADVIDVVTSQKIGSFRDPCTCCSLRFQVRDAQDQDVLEVNGGHCCWQPGLWCPLPCGPCAEVRFDVEDVHSHSTVATISKRVPGFLSWLLMPDIDNYHVHFEQIQDPRWKAILLALTIFMDFRYFNNNRNQRLAQNMEAENRGY